MYLAEEIQNKWAPVLDHDGLGTIKDQHRRSVTAIMLENTERALTESAAHGSYQTLTETSSTTPVNFMGASSSTAGAGGGSSGLQDGFNTVSGGGGPGTQIAGGAGTVQSGFQGGGGFGQIASGSGAGGAGGGGRKIM
jgi:hypothetical protein